MDNIQPPDQEELEKAVRDLFKDGDIKGTSRHSRIPYGTLTKKLNPNDTTESIAYEFLMFLYGAEKARPGLGEEVWALVSGYKRLMMPKGSVEAVGIGEAARTFGEFVAAAESSPERFEVAKQRHADTVERVTVYAPASHLRNVG